MIDEESTKQQHSDDKVELEIAISKGLFLDIQVTLDGIPGLGFGEFMEDAMSLYLEHLKSQSIDSSLSELTRPSFGYSDTEADRAKCLTEVFGGNFSKAQIDQLQRQIAA